MKYLKAKQQKSSKGKEIKYKNQPEMQDYLLPNELLTLEKQRKLFKFRSRMNFLPSNFPSSNSKLECESPCNKNLTNKHLYECKLLNENDQNEQNYEKIFNGTIDEKNRDLSVLEKKYEKLKKYNVNLQKLMKSDSRKTK